MRVHRLVVTAIVLALASSTWGLAAGPPCVVPTGAVAGDLSQHACTYMGADGVAYPAECGTLIVPETRNDPRARLIALPLIRVRATSAQPAEPIFWLSGGPGSSNMVVGGLGHFLDNHDVVMVGYRGVDGPVVLDCPEIPSALRKTGGDLASPEALTRYGQALARCAGSFRAQGVDIDGCNVLEVIEDMERRLVRRSVTNGSACSARVTARGWRSTTRICIWTACSDRRWSPSTRPAISCGSLTCSTR